MGGDGPDTDNQPLPPYSGTPQLLEKEQLGTDWAQEVLFGMVSG